MLSFFLNVCTILACRVLQSPAMRQSISASRRLIVSQCYCVDPLRQTTIIFCGAGAILRDIDFFLSRDSLFPRSGRCWRASLMHNTLKHNWPTRSCTGMIEDSWRSSILILLFAHVGRQGVYPGFCLRLCMEFVKPKIAFANRDTSMSLFYLRRSSLCESKLHLQI